MATDSSILAWEIPWIEKPGRLQSMGLQRVGHDLATKQQQPLSQISFVSVTSLSVTTSVFIHVVANGIISFFFMVEQHSIESCLSEFQLCSSGSFLIRVWLWFDYEMIAKSMQSQRQDGLPLWLSWSGIWLQRRRPGYVPRIGKMPWGRDWLPTPVFWPGEFHGLSMGSQRVGHN